MRIFMSRTMLYTGSQRRDLDVISVFFIPWYFHLGRCSNTDRSHHLQRSKLNFCVSNNERMTS